MVDTLPRQKIYFYSHPSARGDFFILLSHNGKGISTHTPPRGVTGYLFGLFVVRYISTHTPPRGVTQSVVEFWTLDSISTHTPPRGVTRSSCRIKDRVGLFLLTPLREG